jgi:hypothetical protein
VPDDVIKRVKDQFDRAAGIRTRACALATPPPPGLLRQCQGCFRVSTYER